MSSALAYLAGQHIAHNDIKPANITYSPQRGAVLIDFEMATSTVAAAGTASGGTPWYLPPKFLNSPKNRGAGGDVWALGVTMLYVLGRIGLPEKTVEHWRIHDVADRRGEARRAMTTWIRSVAGASQLLDGEDRVQRLVRRMLERGVDTRVRAEQVLVVLEEKDGGG